MLHVSQISNMDLYVDRMCSATDGLDVRSAVSEICSRMASLESDDAFRSEALSLLNDYGFMSNSMSLLTECKLNLSRVAVVEGSSEVCQLFVLLLTSPIASQLTKASIAGAMISFKLDKVRD